MTTRILVVGDIHLADRPPLGRKEGYREQILAKLDEVVDIAERESVDVVLSLGDYFHSKRPNFTSHATIQVVQNLLARCPVPWYALIGNHDVGPEGLASIGRQPLGVLHDTFGFEILPDSVALDDVLIVARHSDDNLSLDPDYYRLTEEEQERGKDKTVIMAAHAPIVAPGEDRPYPHLKFDALREHIEGVDLFLCGDIHEPMFSGGVCFLNPGALARTQRQKQDYERAIQVCLVETTKGDHSDFAFTDILLKSALPAEEVFIGQEQNGSGEITDQIASFVEALAGGLATEQAPLETLLGEIEGVSDEVKGLVKEYLEAAGL